MHSAHFSHLFYNLVSELYVSTLRVDDARRVIELYLTLQARLAKKGPNTIANFFGARDNTGGALKRLRVARHVAAKRAFARASSTKRHDNFGATEFHDGEILTKINIIAE